MSMTVLLSVGASGLRWQRVASLIRFLSFDCAPRYGDLSTNKEMRSRDPWDEFREQQGPSVGFCKFHYLVEFGGRGLRHWFGTSPLRLPLAEQLSSRKWIRGRVVEDPKRARPRLGRVGVERVPGREAMCPGLLRFPAWARRSPPGPQRSSAAQLRRNAIGGSSWPPTHPKNNPPAGCRPTGEENLLSHGASKLLDLLQSDHRPL
ncbi:hypothetical protein LEMLEM_LOCUS13189 [Lemmus lemmus]